MLDNALRASVLGHVRQVETLTDLEAGHFAAVTTVERAFRGCTIGLGVAEAADGEIVALDDLVWRVPADGAPLIAPPELGLPFAVAASGGVASTVPLPAGTTMSTLVSAIDRVRGDAALGSVVAVRVDGTFTDVLLRSEPRQEPPYQLLSHVLEHEVRFAFAEWAGTLVGFRFPDASDGVAIPGLHLHALAADRASGGHCHRATVVAARLTAWIDDVEFTVS